MGVIATDAYDKSTQIIDKDNVLDITDIEFYDNYDCIDNGTDKHKVNSFIENSVYYAKVFGVNHDDPLDISYQSIAYFFQSGLVGGTTSYSHSITDSLTFKHGVFKITFGEITSDNITDHFDCTIKSLNLSITFTKSIIKSITIYNCLVRSNRIDDFYSFRKIFFDGSNYIAVGEVYSGGSYSDALIVKFDSNLNIIAAKTYGDTFNDTFISVAVDDTDINNICYIAVGNTSADIQGSFGALIVKFDSNLNIIAAKIYGGSLFDAFNSVAVDNTDINNIYYIAVGNTYSEGQGYDDALIVKFDSNLNIVSNGAKIYGGSYYDNFNSVAVDNTDINNIYYIAVGYTSSEGQGNDDALIVKFDSNLNIVSNGAKIYGGTANDAFYSIAIDSINSGGPYYIAVGNTLSEGQGNGDGLIVKFDSNLNIVPNGAKIYGGTANDAFYSIAIDSINSGGPYYIAVGHDGSEGQGNGDALIVKFDSDLNKLAANIYGQTDSDEFFSVAINNNGNYIADGYSFLSGIGTVAFLVNIFELPIGSFVSSDPQFYFSNSNLVPSDVTVSPNLILASIAGFTLINSSLILNNSTLSLSAIPYTENIDIITN